MDRDFYIFEGVLGIFLGIILISLIELPEIAFEIIANLVIKTFQKKTEKPPVLRKKTINSKIISREKTIS